VPAEKEHTVKKMIWFGVAALALTMTAGVGVRAEAGAVEQESAPAKPAASQSAPERRQVPLKIQLVLSRYQGDKKLSSVPYVLWVTGADRQPEPTSLRMGVRIPVISTTFAADKDGKTPQASYNYQNVGTDIDCTATVMGDGTYRLSLTVNDSSIYSPDKSDAHVPATVAAAPAFRSFTSRFTILLRDNQTAQYTSATDQVSGEVLKIDATLNVLK
jgi:hypothetical protein